MLTTIALALLNLTLLVIIIRLERELVREREQATWEHDIAVILQQVARKEWRLAQAWKERAEHSDMDGLIESVEAWVNR